jgi:AcrR family transcriptional regulator
LANQASEQAKSKELGRPRSFSDEDVFAAVTRVAQEQGFAGLSLAAIAKKVGCTGQALNARFGSRMGLLVAYVDWASARDVERFQHVRAQNLTPLETLRARFHLPLEGREEELSSGAEHVRIMSLIIESNEYPEFARRIRNRIEVFEHQLSLLIREANAVGELKVDNPEGLSHLIMVGTSGGSTLWPAGGQGSIVEEMNRIIELLLAPYIVEQPGR